MTIRFTQAALAVAGLSVAISGIMFMRADSAYAMLRKDEAGASMDQLMQASGVANYWFLVLIGAVNVAIGLLASFIFMKRKASNEAAAKACDER